MQSFFSNKFKLLNIGLFILVSISFLVIKYYIDAGYCVSNCTLEEKKGLINPLYHSLKGLTLSVALLLFVPTHIFRRWLFYVAPIPLLVTFILISNISVYGGGILYISRGKMAENGMFVLAIITLIFVVGHLVYDWKKK